MPTNVHRAEWADHALGTFQAATGCDREDALPDLLCDLIHLATREAWDFGKAVTRAKYHYEAEVGEPEQELPQKPRHHVTRSPNTT